jgi:hypothetical protein
VRAPEVITRTIHAIASVRHKLATTASYDISAVVFPAKEASQPQPQSQQQQQHEQQPEQPQSQPDGFCIVLDKVKPFSDKEKHDETSVFALINRSYLVATGTAGFISHNIRRGRRFVSFLC